MKTTNVKLKQIMIPKGAFQSVDSDPIQEMKKKMEMMDKMRNNDVIHLGRDGEVLEDGGSENHKATGFKIPEGTFA